MGNRQAKVRLVQFIRCWSVSHFPDELKLVDFVTAARPLPGRAHGSESRLVELWQKMTPHFHRPVRGTE